MKLFYLILISLGALNCNNASLEKAAMNEQEASDNLIISEKSVVIFAPSLTAIDHLKKEKGADFYIMADDANYNIALAHDLLARKKLKTINTTARYFTFIKSNGENITIDKQTLESKWGAILFQPDKAPKEVALADLELEVDQYFVGE